jgi:hypothetical protein
LKKKSKASTGHTLWNPTSAPSPYRPTIRGETPFVEERNTETEHDLKWLDPAKGLKVKQIDKMAR